MLLLSAALHTIVNNLRNCELFFGVGVLFTWIMLVGLRIYKSIHIGQAATICSCIAQSDPGCVSITTHFVCGLTLLPLFNCQQAEPEPFRENKVQGLQVS